MTDQIFTNSAHDNAGIAKEENSVEYIASEDAEQVDDKDTITDRALKNDPFKIWLYGIAIAVSYSLTYLWRYPIFVLPVDRLEQTVCTMFGKPLDLQTCFSLAMTIGFGLAKIPAISIMSSSYFFRHRTGFILAIFVASAFFMCFGTSVFYAILPAQVACVFVSCFFSSWIFGAQVTFIEGRVGTEKIIATINFCYVYAGNLSRGVASLLLEVGTSAALMPMLAGGFTLPFACYLFYVSAQIPVPSVEDIETRSKRQSMSSKQRTSFVKENFVGLVCVFVPYALLSSVRSFRDYYAQQIFTAALGMDSSPPSFVFFTVDLPGALLSCLVQYYFHKFNSNVTAFTVIVSTICASIIFMAVTTVIFDVLERSFIVGYLWLVCLGIGIYTAYSIYSPSIFDRLIGLTGAAGTCSFLVFASDGLGYFGTTTLLLYKTFSAKSDDDDDSGDDDDQDSSTNNSALRLFLMLTYISCTVLCLCLTGAWFYFVYLRKENTRNAEHRFALLKTDEQEEVR